MLMVSKFNTNPGGAILLKMGKANCQGGMSSLGRNQEFVDIALLFCLRSAPNFFF